MSFIFPSSALAHQPRIVENNSIQVSNPETSQAFYGELKGAPDEFVINSDQDFRLYLGLLVPDLPGIKKDLSVQIFQTLKGKETLLTTLDGSKFNWTPYFEEFGGDNYFWGPEFSADDSVRGVALKGRLVPAGRYRIKVYSPSNLGKYSLAVGDIEAFPMKESLNALKLVPQLKLKFFNEPWYRVIFSPFGGTFVWGSFLLGSLFGFLWRLTVKSMNKKGRRHLPTNIGSQDRLIRFGLGILLFAWAIYTGWSPWLFFASGFCIFEGLFSWCGLYQLMGKNTCPV